MTTRIELAGYQGSDSVLTRGMECLAEQLRECPQMEAAVTADVTGTGESALSLFDSVEQGRRQMCYGASGYFSARVPALAVLDLPFAVHDRAAALSALDGALGASLAGAVRAHTGLAVLGWWDNGFRHISNRLHPIAGLKDCQALRIRTLDSALYRAVLAGMGFVPVTTDVKELVHVVSTHAVDAQENPLTNFMLFGLWQHHPYVSLTGHLFGVAMLLCHGAWLDSLDAAALQGVRKAAAAATQLQRRLAAAEDAKALTRLEQVGVEPLHRRDLAVEEMAAAARRAAALPVAARSLAALYT